MLNEEIIIMKEKGLGSFECDSIEQFIHILKIMEAVNSEIPGVKISEAAEDDNLNKGETISDLESGEVTHYCAKTYKGERFINSDQLEQWACRFLITDGGRPNRFNISVMQLNGFDVYPGEADCFSWLTGVIETKKGKIVFG
jgi:hypothetical protein